MKAEHMDENAATDVLLIVNTAGRIRVLYAPFRVKCIIAVNQIPTGAWVMVDKLSSDSCPTLLYFIQDTWFKHHYFMVVINF
jgi:hypothetical protein